MFSFSQLPTHLFIKSFVNLFNLSYFFDELLNTLKLTPFNRKQCSSARHDCVWPVIAAGGGGAPELHPGKFRNSPSRSLDYSKARPWRDYAQP